MASLVSACVSSRAHAAPRCARSRRSLVALLGAALAAVSLSAAPLLTTDVGDDGRQQRIDGFGTCMPSGSLAEEAWFQDLYFNELRSSIVRVDMTPRFKSPYSDWSYNSPWFHNNPPLPGPENNNVRTYTGPNDYSRLYAGRNAPIAVMGPDIEQNIQVFDYSADLARGGVVAGLGTERADELGGMKVLGCFWSPAPWVKVATGNTTPNYGGILPVAGTPWPFLWFDNFAGGKLDISNTPLEVFNDGTGPTSALTQYARSCAAYILGYQRHFGFKFYAISLQNEPGFEQFFNSATYKLSHEYITALKALAEEFAKHDELKHIIFSGTDDLLGGDAYALWQYGGGATTNHKNLQYLANIEADPVARELLQIYSIHGYAPNGVNAPDADPLQWQWWAYGWTESPAPGIPANVQGFVSTGKRSWMTETSGENANWLWPTSGFPGFGAWSVALRIHQALTAGQQNAWIYWQLSDADPVSDDFTLSGSAQLTSAPKFNAAKHFFRHIRPNAQRVEVASQDPAVQASAYIHDDAQTITYVALNTSSSPVTIDVVAPTLPSGISSFDVFTSSNGNYWVQSTAAVVDGKAQVTIPGYGVSTIVGTGTSISLYADKFASGWTASVVNESTTITHWQSERSLRFIAPRKHATFTLKNPSGTALGENDLIEFHVRAATASAGFKKIELQFAGSKHEVTAKNDAVFIDGEPIHGKRVSIPNDGEWHTITIDVKELKKKRTIGPLTEIVLEADAAQEVLIDDVVLRSL